MGHTYVSNRLHCVFSTKHRAKLVPPEFQERLWAFMGGIARQRGMKALAIGGMQDHVHILLSLPPTQDLSKALQLIKGASSKWVNDNFPSKRRFGWQEGYAAFSVSVSHVERTVEYIHNQEQHHRKQSFEEEFISFLKKHGIEYDERYVFG